MNATFRKEFLDIIADLTLYLKHQHVMGMGAIPSREGNEMMTILDALGKNISLQETTSHQSVFQTLDEVRQELGNCTRCSLCESRKNIVFGQGNPGASLVFIGEAPGGEEDAAGEPFVGEAGQLLTKIIQAIKLTREEVYITNLIKCRPPNNRDPKPEEIGACFPFLKKQLKIIQPRLICALGKYSAQSLLETTEKISRLRGNQYAFQDITVVPTFHPASLLRNPEWKPAVWKDMQLIQKLLEEVT